MALSAASRVTLLKEIIARLSSEEWTFLDLTLREFGLPTEQIWNGGRDAYVTEMLKDVKDQTLIELARYLGLQLPTSWDKFGIDIFDARQSTWRDGFFRCFVTHLATERKFAAEMQTQLLRFGISCFVAHNDIEPTSEWQTQIEVALATCDSLVALMHPNFHKSNWTDQELGFAMGRGLPVFAVQLGEVPYGFIARFQAFNGSGKTATVLAREIFDSYRRHKQTRSKMATVLLSLFENSGTFEGAKTRIGFLEEMEIWEPSFATRIGAALRTNTQISNSWGVPERVKALIQKWS